MNGYTLSLPGALETPEQISSFLYQLVEQLNAAAEQTDHVIEQARASTSNEVSETVKKTQESTYSELKALIQKSGDVIKNTFTTEITEKLGEYVVQSEFGEYKETVIAQRREAIDGALQSYYKSTEIDSKYGKYVTSIQGSIESGILNLPGYGDEIGIAIGQNIRFDANGKINPNSNMAYYLSDRLEFYINGVRAAYFTNGKLHVNQAEFTDRISLDKWEITRTNGFTIKWNGGAAIEQARYYRQEEPIDEAGIDTDSE